MLPTNFKPMLATMAEPFDSPDYTYEIKWDGYRCLAFLNSQTRLLSRNQKDLTPIFPELTTLHQQMKVSGCIIDGEIIAIRNGKPSFWELQKRAQLQNLKRTNFNIPVIYIAFDLLYYKDQPIYSRPIEERRNLLIDNTKPTTEFILATPIEESGIAYFEAVSKLGLEGVIAKKKGTPYLPGKRVRSWLKFKRKLIRNFIVCGYVLNPTHQRELRSLILGAYRDGYLQFFGMVGSGFTQKEQVEVYQVLQEIQTRICPFTGGELTRKNTCWVEPIVICEVEYLELTDEGYLRHPVLKKFRPELKPEDCIYEE